MRHLFLLLCLCGLVRPATSQTVSIVGTSPVDGEAGVDLTTVVSFTFSHAVDPLLIKWALTPSPHEQIEVGDPEISADGLTFRFQ